MRRVVVTVVAAAALALVPTAYGHPSEIRAETAFHGGPHCHTNQLSGNFAFPSHRAHVATGAHVTIFAGAACP